MVSRGAVPLGLPQHDFRRVGLDGAPDTGRAEDLTTTLPEERDDGIANGGPAVCHAIGPDDAWRDDGA